MKRNDYKWFTDEWYDGSEQDFINEYSGFIGGLVDYGDQRGPQTEEEWVKIILDSCEAVEETIPKMGVEWILEALEEDGYVKGEMTWRWLYPSSQG